MVPSFDSCLILALRQELRRNGINFRFCSLNQNESVMTPDELELMRQDQNDCVNMVVALEDDARDRTSIEEGFVCCFKINCRVVTLVHACMLAIVTVG